MPTKKEQTVDPQDTLFAPKAETEENQKKSWEIWEEQQLAKRKAKNIFEKMQEAKCDVQDEVKGKSGQNDYKGFSYMELSDFLPIVNRVFQKLGLFSQFGMDSKFDENGVNHDTGILTIYNIDNTQEFLKYTMRGADSNIQGSTPIQQFGGVVTYLKRYLYTMALDLSVPDQLDKQVGNMKFEAQKANADQVAILGNLMAEMPEKGDALLKHYKVSAAKDLTVEQASEAIKAMKIYKAKKGAVNGTGISEG